MEPPEDGHDGTLPVAADDDDARAKVIELVGSLGFRPIDAGPLVMARALEAMGVLNIVLQSHLGTVLRAVQTSIWGLVRPHDCPHHIKHRRLVTATRSARPSARTESGRLWPRMN